MLTTFTLDTGIASPVWDTSTGNKIWQETGVAGDVSWANSTQNNAVIESTSAVTVTVGAGIQAGTITFGQGGPYTLKFLAGTPYTISGGTILLQSALNLDVVAGARGTIVSNISGSSDALTIQDTGTLVLGGSVTVASLLSEFGAVSINDTLDVTNGDNTGNGLQVALGSTISGSGTINLTGGAPFDYTSNAPSYFSGPINLGAGSNLDYEGDTGSVFAGPINGAGAVEEGLNTMTTGPYTKLTLGSENTNIGGTNIQQGELVLGTSEASLSGPALGSGALILGQTGTLDLNGCSVTLSGLEDGTGTNGGTIWDPFTQDTAAVDMITLDIPAGQTDKFTGVFDSGANHGIPGSGGNPAIRLVKTGGGQLVLGHANSSGDFSFELDSGCVTLPSTSSPGPTPGTLQGRDVVVNGGTLDLNGNDLIVNSLNGIGGVITDTSAKTVSKSITTLIIEMTAGGHPSLYAGQIEDGASANERQIELDLKSSGGLLTLTGQNTNTGGIVIDDGWLQVGDGTTNGAIAGNVTVNAQDGLTFDVSAGAGSTEVYSGSITTSIYSTGYTGSILKTGVGSLELTGDNSYTGAFRIEQGTVVSGSGTAFSPGTDLIVDNGAKLDLDGHSNATPIRSLTLNYGTIQSTGAAAILTATDSFNLAQGSIGGTTGQPVTLEGTASLNKRTDGTVTFDASSKYSGSGGVFIDQGTLTNATATPTILVTWTDASGDGEWNATSNNWLIGASTTSMGWPPTDGTTNYVAVFPSGTGTVHVTSNVEPSGIIFQGSGADIEGMGGEIIIPSAVGGDRGNSLVVRVPSGGDDTLGCALTGDGSVTIEGGRTLQGDGTIQPGGTLQLGNGGNSGSAVNSYADGTYIDDGAKVQLLSSGALGAQTGDLVVDDSSKLDLNDEEVTVGSLNSSFALASDSSTIITDSSDATDNNSITTLTIVVGTEPGLFAGSISNGPSRGISLAVESAYSTSNDGLLMTLSGDNEAIGRITTDGGLQIGDGESFWELGGSIYSDANDVVFDLPALNVNGPESFDGSIVSARTIPNAPTEYGSVLVVSGQSGAGAIEFGGGMSNDSDRMLVEGATLDVSSATALQDYSDLVLDDGATLDLTGSPSGSHVYTLTVNNGAVLGGDLRAGGFTELCEGSISSSVTLTGGPLVKSGNATNTNSATTFVVNGQTTTNCTILVTGTLQLGNSAALAGTTDLIVDGGTLDLGGETETVNTVTMGNGGGQILNGGTLLAASFLFAPDSQDPGTDSLSFGSLAPATTITVCGTGQISLSDLNGSFGGVVTVDSGILDLDLAAGEAPPAHTFVLAGATLADALAGSITWATIINNMENSGDYAAGAFLGFDTGTGPYNYPTAISDTGATSPLGIVVLGDGSLKLSGANTYSGGTMVLSGTLQLGNAAALGSSSGSITVGTLTAGGTLDLGGYNQIVTGPATLVNGAIQNGTLDATSYTVENGIISAILANHSNAMTDASPLEVKSNNTNTNTVILTGLDKYSGQTTIDPGATLQLGDGISGDDGTISDTSNSFLDNGTLRFDIYESSYPNFTCNVSGLGSLLQDGIGPVGLSGTNSYTGGTFVWSGVLIINAVTSLPSGGALQIGVNAPLSFGSVWSSNSVQAMQPAGTYGVGSIIDIEVPMGQTVTVTGDPELALNLGANTEYAQYVGGSGTSTLVFQYFVQPGDSSQALDYTSVNAVVLNGGTIENSSGAPVTPPLSSPGSGNSLSVYEILVINTTAPVVSSIEAVGPATISAGDVMFAVTFSKPVFNVMPADFVLTGSGVTGNIDYVVGGGTSFWVRVDQISGSGTLGLNLVDDDSITDVGGNPLGGPGAGNGDFASGPEFLIVSALPGTLTGGALTGAAYETESGMLAGFTDSRGLGYGAGDYTALVKWGDGSQAMESVTYDPAYQRFEVGGSHTYTEMGNFVVEVLVSDPNGLMAIVDGTASIADAPLSSVAFTPPAAMEGNVFSDVVLHFTDLDPTAAAGQFSAVIWWGDGASSSTSDQTSSCLVVADQSGGFDVVGIHRYFRHNSGMTFTVTVMDSGGASLTESDTSFSVAVAPLYDPILTLPPLGEATVTNVPLFTFTDMDSLHENRPPAYLATVSWGDGSSTVYTYSNDGSSPIVANWPNRDTFTVYGSHTYSSAVSGATFSVTVTYSGGPSVSLSETLPTVTSIDCAGSPLAAGASSLQFAVTFNEAVTGVAANDFTLSGSNSAGTITSVTGSGANYVVTVSGVTGSGTLGLNFVNNGSVTDAFGTPGGLSWGRQRQFHRPAIRLELAILLGWRQRRLQRRQLERGKPHGTAPGVDQRGGRHCRRRHGNGHGFRVGDRQFADHEWRHPRT
jgi:fibronectin-binding autotransporter adhesin